MGLRDFKPAGSVRTHLFLAAAMWTVVGGVLATLATVWLAPARLWLVPPAAVLGIAKAWLALRGAARRTVDRIRLRGDGRCLGGFLSVRSWLFVILMAGGGRVLREVLPREVVGFLYVAVGVALLTASRHLWLEFSRPR